MKKIITVAAVLFVSLFVGLCSVAAYNVVVERDIKWFDSFNVGDQPIDWDKTNGIVDTFIDEDNGVICYVVKGWQGRTFAISCINKK
jgi:hypothetical protein